jgi:hypothetical protein
MRLYRHYSLWGKSVIHCGAGFKIDTYEGVWTLRFNSDWQGYGDDFLNHPSTDIVAEPGEYDGFPFHGTLSIGPYSVLIFSQ